MRLNCTPASLKTKYGAANSSSQKPVLRPVLPSWSCGVRTIRIFTFLLPRPSLRPFQLRRHSSITTEWLPAYNWTIVLAILWYEPPPSVGNGKQQSQRSQGLSPTSCLKLQMGHRVTSSKIASALCERILLGRYAKMERRGGPAVMACFGREDAIGFKVYGGRDKLQDWGSSHFFLRDIQC